MMRGELARQRIADALSGQDAMDPEELSRRTDLTRTALRHHLRIMQAEGHVSTVVDKQRPAWFWLHNRTEGVLSVKLQTARPPPVIDRRRPNHGDVVRYPGIGVGESSRRRIMELIEAHPGIHKLELSRRLGLGVSTVDYQVRTLEDRLSIRVLRHRGRVMLFPASIDGEKMGAIAAVNDPLSEAILRQLNTRGITIAEVARRTGTTRKTVSRRIKHMEQAGVIHRKPTGIRVSSAAMALLALIA